MKTILIFTLLITATATAQKVDVFDKNHKIIKRNIEKKEVPDKLDYLPDGKYYLQEWNGRKVKECIYIKKTKMDIV